MESKQDKKAKKAAKAAAKAQRIKQERQQIKQERQAIKQERQQIKQERQERKAAPTPTPASSVQDLINKYASNTSSATAPAPTTAPASTPAPSSRPAAPDPVAAKMYDSSLLAGHMGKFKESNPVVADLIRFADDSPNRKVWSNTYDDDGTIQWSTASQKGTPERRQEKKTFKQLQQLTGINFEKVKPKRDSDIHIHRYKKGDKYFNRKYSDTDWLQSMKDNFGGTPGGLHHYGYRKDDRPFSRVEAPKFKTKLGDKRYGKQSQQTLSHEIAHALGLRDLSTPEEQAEVANYSVMGYDSNWKLAGGKNRFGATDIDAIIKNYGLSGEKEPDKKSAKKFKDLYGF